MSVNIWGTDTADVGVGFCPSCEREAPHHYESCPTRVTVISAGGVTTGILDGNSIIAKEILATNKGRQSMKIGHSYPVRDTGHVARLIAQPEDDDGRSEWRWFWYGGDLIVGFFPHGNSYMECEGPFTDDFQAARANGNVSEHTMEDE